MHRYRVRIRFRKEGDLRLIGHLDLVRAFERLFRRVGLQLRMTEGFHPKPRMQFAAALGLGLEGADEVAEIELTEPLSAEELLDRFHRHQPPGLAVTRIELPDAKAPKLRIASTSYEIEAPREQLEAVAPAIAALLSQESHIVERPRGKPPVDLLTNLTALELRGASVYMQFQTIDGPSAGPRDVLAALGLGNLEEQGCILKRTSVETVS